MDSESTLSCRHPNLIIIFDQGGKAFTEEAIYRTGMLLLIAGVCLCREYLYLGICLSFLEGAIFS